MDERRQLPDRRRNPSPGRRGRPPLSPDGPSTGVHIRLSAGMYDRTYALASQRRVTIPALIRAAIDRILRDATV